MAALRLLALLALTAAADAASVKYTYCNIGTNGSTTGCAPVVPGYVGACFTATQAVDGNCYCGSASTGTGCLKFTAVGSVVQAAIWVRTGPALASEKKC